MLKKTLQFFKHSTKNRLSSLLLHKSIGSKVSRTVILPGLVWVWNLVYYINILTFLEQGPEEDTWA